MTTTTVDRAPAASPRPRVVSRRRPMGSGTAFTLAFLASIFCLQYALFLIDSLFWDRVIKLGSIVLLAIAFPYRRVPANFRLTILLYLALFGTAMVGSLASGSGVGVVQVAKIVLAWSVLPLIVLRFHPGEAPPPVLVRILQFWSVLWVLQALALWWHMYRLQPPPDHWIMIEKLGEGSETRSFGIYGYSNTFAWLAGGALFFRPQGWFLEPSFLASFLLYPALLALGMFMQRKTIRRFLLFALLGGGIVLTFSLGGFLGFSAGVIAFLFVRPAKKDASTFRRFMAPVLLALMFLAFAQFLMNRMYAIHERLQTDGSVNATTRLLARDPKSQKLVQNYFKVKEMTQLLADNPLGVGLAHTLGRNELTSPSAPVYWAMAGGIPAIVVLVLLYGHLMYAYAVPLLMSRVPAYRGIAAGFVAVTVQGLQIGTWLFPYALFVVAIMMLAANHIRHLPELARHPGR